MHDICHPSCNCGQMAAHLEAPSLEMFTGWQGFPPRGLVARGPWGPWGAAPLPAGSPASAMPPAGTGCWAWECTPPSPGASLARPGSAAAASEQLRTSSGKRWRTLGWRSRPAPRAQSRHDPAGKCQGSGSATTYLMWWGFCPPELKNAVCPGLGAVVPLFEPWMLRTVARYR